MNALARTPVMSYSCEHSGMQCLKLEHTGLSDTSDICMQADVWCGVSGVPLPLACQARLAAESVGKV